MYANVLIIMLAVGLLLQSQFAQTVAYLQGANNREAGRIADLAMQTSESNFIQTLYGTTPGLGVQPTICYTGTGAPTSSTGACTFNATTTISEEGDSTTGITSANQNQETSSNVNTDVEEVRTAYLLTVAVTSGNGTPLATKTRTMTARMIPSTTANQGQFITIENSTDATELIGGGRKGTAGTTEGDIAGCDPTASNCGTRTTVQSWSICSEDAAMAGGSLNAAQQAWCAANPRNAAYDNQSTPQTAPTGDYVNTSVFQNPTWTNGNGAPTAVAP